MTARRITESAIEESAIELLEKQGFRYVPERSVAPTMRNSNAGGV